MRQKRRARQESGMTRASLDQAGREGVVGAGGGASRELGGGQWLQSPLYGALYGALYSVE